MEAIIARIQSNQRPPPIRRDIIEGHGLRPRPTYNELINVIETDPDKIKYPNREAKFLRNSFQLSFLDKFSTETLNAQQENLLKHQIVQANIAQLAKG